MEFLKIVREDGVATVSINRPPANALSSGLIQEIDRMLDSVENDDSVRVIVFHGEGRFFSAGADIKEFTTVSSGEEFTKLSAAGQDVFERLESFKKLVIAAIHGAALGGGLELAMGCHIRVVTEKAKLGLPELQLGLIPGFAGTQRLPRYVGVARAAEMLLTSEPITGEEAVRFGLANHVFSEEELLAKTMEMAKKIAKKSPIAMKAALQMLQFTKSDSFYEGVKAEADSFGEVFVSEDAKEGIQAFIEKREPQFKGN
ncbi:enoyl-CoA hydratase [Sporosarcina thermotolerans]|uniref:Enoyl-CoA hydratase n=1 Tax=Sporosarcina thermotolerans TaxID=633404 RepID=A0AAW9AEU5_9BACL|nr:enoyl-CoA hydratase [Sporosarcina thermotolerans]MDW0118161.1 enoyl-CoA hydratase [Sporosarcina thermotolerans]WHT47649.1 enoyl-CoA hydratase [Sporosarcina thermotolerans]